MAGRFEPKNVAEAIDHYLQRPSKTRLADTLKYLSDEKSVTEADGRALSRFAASFVDEFIASGDLHQLHTLIAAFQNVGGRDAVNGVRAEGEGDSHLLRIVDGLEARCLRDGTDGYPSPGDVWMFALKVAALYSVDGVAERIVRGARSGIDDGFMWSIVFGRLQERDGEGNPHPAAAEVIDGLREPLPEGFIGVAFLDLCNQLAIQNLLTDHPFDSPAGVARLESFLRSTDPAEFSYAHSATATLPFLSPEAAAPLFELAAIHPDDGVRTESAWALAKTGDERGIELLAEIAADVKRSLVAVAYLEELGRADAVPAVVRTTEFRALSTMCNWLQHPQEFGRAPDEVELVDRRELYWPPTDDRREMFVIRYHYNAVGDREAEDGHGLVGSVTFALFGETTADKSPEDVYALHCCWELEWNKDPRAPDKRSVEAGRRLLAQHNPGFD